MIPTRPSCRSWDTIHTHNTISCHVRKIWILDKIYHYYCCCCCYHYKNTLSLLLLLLQESKPNSSEGNLTCWLGAGLWVQSPALQGSLETSPDLNWRSKLWQTEAGLCGPDSFLDKNTCQVSRGLGAETPFGHKRKVKVLMNICTLNVHVLIINYNINISIKRLLIQNNDKHMLLLYSQDASED